MKTILSVFDLTTAEKLQLVEDLWDDIAASPESIPVHDWHKEQLAARKTRFLFNPASAISWEAVKQRIRDRYRE